MDFIGKNVIITGGCGVIGKNLARELLQNGVQGIGLFDVIDDPSETLEFLKADLSSQIIKYYKTDVSIKSKLTDSFEMFKKDFTNIDIVIACAGTVNEFDVEKLIGLNLIGAINTMLIGMDMMSVSKSGHGGLIVAISSTNAADFVPFVPFYNATKHGLLAFTKSMGNDFNLKNHGVRFITICPGRTVSSLIDIKNFQKMYLPEFVPIVSKIIEYSAKQEPELLAKLAIKPMAIGENGSVYVIADGKYKRYVPPRIEDFDT